MMDYKEYSRLRSIARKRIERAAAAGEIPLIKIPTVKEVRASGTPEIFFSAVQNYLNAPGSGLKWAKAEGIKVQQPSFPKAAPLQSMTPQQRKERRQQQNRASKARQQIRHQYPAEQAKKRVSYIKGLQKVINDWDQVNKPMADLLRGLKPKELKSFADYMEYRFSQGDYKNRYTIDTFIRDFGEMVKREYNLSDIQRDFGAFLDKQKSLKKNSKKANRYGISEDEVDIAWRKFVKGGQ